MYECFVYVYVCVLFVSSAYKSQKRSDLGVELQMSMSCHVGPGNQTRVLWEQ